MSAGRLEVEAAPLPADMIAVVGYEAIDCTETDTGEGKLVLKHDEAFLVERNLQIIDAAIRESRAALERDPGNAELRELFAAAYRQKVELLRWATRVATAS